MNIKSKKIRNTKVDVDDYIYNLCKKGYRCIGEGDFATVYHRDNEDFVIKVGIVEYDFLSDGYLRYLTVLNKNNTLFPKINRLSFFRSTDGLLYYVVKILKLLPIKTKKIKVTSKKVANRKVGISHYMDLEDIIVSFIHGLKIIRNKNLKDFCSRYMKVDPNVESLDIHDGNVMYRKVGRAYQFVITDPVC